MEPSAPMATSGSEHRGERGNLGCDHSPIQTSPNCPDPSFRTSLRDCLGISHSSCAQGFFGAGLTQGRVNFWHKPSPFSVSGKKREARGRQSRLPLGTRLSPALSLVSFLPRWQAGHGVWNLPSLRLQALVTFQVAPCRALGC